MKRRLFHRTTAKAATSIMRNGFRDGYITPIGGIRLRGVWLSDKPLDTSEGAKGIEALLAVRLDLPKAKFDFYELAEEGKPYQEWCFPAKLLRLARIHQIE